MSKARVLAFSGSTRSGSFNRRMAAIAARGAREAEGDVTIVDLRELALPIYDADLEADGGPPGKALALRQMFLDSDGLIIAAPEYNGSLSGALKNAIDWVSRSPEGQPNIEPFQNKTAVLMSASPGRLGGLRGLADLRVILSGIGVLVLPQQLAVPAAHEAFDGDELKDARQGGIVAGLGASVVQVVNALQSAGVRTGVAF